MDVTIGFFEMFLDEAHASVGAAGISHAMPQDDGQRCSSKDFGQEGHDKERPQQAPFHVARRMMTLMHHRVWQGEADKERVWCVTWSPDGPLLCSMAEKISDAMFLGKRFASCGSESVVRIWEREENWHCCAVLEGIHTKTIRRVRWSPNGSHIACASFDATVSIWECRSGDEWEQVCETPPSA